MKDASKDILDYKQLKTPAIHIQPSIKTFQKLRVLGKFTEKSLIIINIKQPPLDPAVTYILPYLLNQLHELHIVFITEEDPISWQEDLFIYCFSEGFINTLLIHHLNRTLSLYSYSPYPVIQTLRMMGIADYLERWRKLNNFQKLSVVTIPDTVEPRTIRYVNRQGQLVHAGYIYNAFVEFIRRHNGSLKFTQPMPEDGAFAYAFAQVARKQIDFVCYPKELTWKVTSTSPLHLLKEYIIMPHPRPIASYLYFARPFTWTMWLAVIATVGYGMVMLYVSCGTHRTDFGLHFLSSWCHLLFLPQVGISISNWQQFAIHFLLILTGFVLTNLYLALLSSMLTSGLFEPQFNTLKDLIHSPYPLLVDDYYMGYLQSSVSIPDEVKIRMRSVSPISLNTARIGLNASFMYSLIEDRMEGILYQQHLLKVPRFVVVPESFLDGLMAFPVAPSLPYLNMLNAFLRRIFECGILTKMKSDAWRDTINSGIYKLMRIEGAEQKPYDLQLYFFAFLLWALGLTLAALCLLLELLSLRMTLQ